jgi:hypothetical protein
MSDEQAVVEFQAHQQDIEKSQEEQDRTVIKIAKPAAEESLESMAAQYAQTLAMEEGPPKTEEPPNEAQQNAQSALDDVKIVIPDGM